MPKISVIVPIYNTAVYLEKCIDSILTQTFRDIEVLCINDGSTDNADALLTRLAKHDKRIKIFNQRNQGPGIARNVGVTHATGTYLCFVDADDMCHPDMLKTAYQQAVKTNADIVCFDSFHYTGNVANTRRLGEEKIPAVLPPLNAQTENTLAAVPVHAFAKLFKRDLIVKNNIVFSNGTFFATDLGFTLPALALAKNMIHLDDTLYYYRVGNKKSLTWQEKTFTQIFPAFEALKAQFSSHPNAVDILYFFEKAQLRLTLHCIKRSMLFLDIRVFYNVYQKYLKNLIEKSELNLTRLRNDHAIEVGEKFKGFPYAYARYFRPDLFHGDPLSLPTSTKSLLFARYFPYIISDVHRQAVKVLDIAARNPLFQRPLKPARFMGNIPIVFAADQINTPVVMVAVKSLLEHTDKNHFYDIIILHENVLKRHQDAFTELIGKRKNISIRFYNIGAFFNTIPELNAFIKTPFQRTSFYKIFIPDALQYYGKVLYLDSDILCRANVAQLYQTNIKKYCLAAVPETTTQALLTATDENLRRATYDKMMHLNLFNPAHYFNTGVLLMNLERIQKLKMGAYLKKILTQFKGEKFSAADLFNLVFENQTKSLNSRWNVQTSFDTHQQAKHFSESVLKSYCKTMQRPFILHFDAADKPWTNPLLPNTSAFTKYLPSIPQAFLNLLGHMPTSFTQLTKKPADNVIPIAYILDYRTVVSTQVSVFSLLMHKHPKTRYHFYIIGINLMPETISEFQKLVAGQADITFLNQPPLQTRLDIQPSSILKFELPTILKPLNRVIYLNDSVLAQDDLTELYQTPLKKTYAGLVKDLDRMKSLEHHRRHLKHYYNDDMMLLNLKKMRQDNIPLKLKMRCLYEASRGGTDQSIINFIFNQNVTDLFLAANLKPNVTSEFLNKLLPIYQHTLADVHRHADPILLNLTRPDNPMAIYNQPLFKQYLQKMNQLYPTFNAFYRLMEQKQMQSLNFIEHETRIISAQTKPVPPRPAAPKPLKVLFDTSIFTLPQKTGLYRVGLNVLKGICADPRLDVSLLISTSAFQPVSFLMENDLEHLGQKLILMPTLFERAVNPNRITQSLTTGQMNTLKSHDVYFSTFFPTPDVIEQAGLKTATFVHDIFAIRIPELLYTIPQAQKHHKKWIDELHSDYLIFNSTFSQRDFLSYRTDYPAEKTTVSYLGADKNFAPCADSQIAAVRKTYRIPTKKYFMTLSDNMPRKNIEHLIRSFIAFLKKTKATDISLVLAGPHYLNNTKLDALKKTLSPYRKQIIWTGFVDEADLPALYSGALAFVFPSLYEGFGLPVLEALSCGTPVICANNTSLPEVGGTAALYISGKKITETVNALQTMYQKPTARKRLKDKAAEQAAQFSWAKTNKIIADALLKLKH